MGDGLARTFLQAMVVLLGSHSLFLRGSSHKFANSLKKMQCFFIQYSNSDGHEKEQARMVRSKEEMKLKTSEQLFNGLQSP